MTAHTRTSALGLTIHGFEPLDTCSIRLAPGMDVVVGANGIGKSRLLGALTADIPPTTQDGGVFAHYSSFDESWHYDVALSSWDLAREFAEHSGIHWCTPDSPEDLKTYAIGLAAGVLFNACDSYEIDTDGEFFHAVWSSMIDTGMFALWRTDNGWDVWACLRREQADLRLAALIAGEASVSIE